MSPIRTFMSEMNTSHPLLRKWVLSPAASASAGLLCARLYPPLHRSVRAHTRAWFETVFPLRDTRPRRPARFFEQPTYGSTGEKALSTLPERTATDHGRRVTCRSLQSNSQRLSAAFG